MDSSMTSYRTFYHPESNNSYSIEHLPYGNENFIRWNDASSTNIPVHSNTRDLELNPLEYSRKNNYYGQSDNPSMSNECYPSVYQPTDDEESVNPEANPTVHVHSLSGRGERFSLQSTQPERINHSRFVVGNRGVYQQQAQDSLPNLPVENHSLTSQYSSNNPHIHQNTSQYHSHNHSTTLGEVNHNVYQTQYGQPVSNVGVSQQNTSQEQAAKVIFPHRSAVLGEVSENLPVDARRQDRHVSPARELTSVHQPTSMGQTDPFTYNRMGVKDHSLMSRRNRELDKQNPYNHTVPPTVRPMPGSNILLLRDQGGDHALGQGNQTQRPSLNHGTSWNQPVASSNHRLQDYTSNQQPSAPVQYQMAPTPPSQNRPHIENKTGGHQYQDPDYVGKKVFILHFGPTADTIDDNPILKLGVTLRRMKVDVTLDLFEYDSPPNSWPLWYEQRIKESDVVLCIITENFYQQLISNLVLGNSVYNLMNGSSSKSIAFRAVFIDAAKKEMEYIPPAMRGATSYSIFSNRLTPNDDEFANLYAFLTGQNRVEKPPLGNRIVLAPKKSRFGHFSGGPAPAHNRNIQQQQQRQPWQQQGMMYQPSPPPQPAPAPAANPPGVPNVEQANFIFTLLGGDATPIKSIRSHNKMFMQLASKMTAEWEGLGRLLNVSEPDIYAIKMDNIHSVTEQAVQMFRQWLMKNGSKATLGVLTTAVYDSGPQYWNLLDTINNYAPQQ